MPAWASLPRGEKALLAGLGAGVSASLTRTPKTCPLYGDGLFVRQIVPLILYLNSISLKDFVERYKWKTETSHRASYLLPFTPCSPFIYGLLEQVLYATVITRLVSDQKGRLLPGCQWLNDGKQRQGCTPHPTPAGALPAAGCCTLPFTGEPHAARCSVLVHAGCPCHSVHRGPKSRLLQLLGRPPNSFLLQPYILARNLTLLALTSSTRTAFLPSNSTIWPAFPFGDQIHRTSPATNFRDTTVTLPNISHLTSACALSHIPRHSTAQTLVRRHC